MPDKDKPKSKNEVPPISQSDLQKFGNWTGQTDTRAMAADLMKRGLVGADQLYNDIPNTASASGIRNAQSDWKVNAIQEILANARRFNLRTPEQINANKNVLVTNPMWRDAINNPFFNHIHSNFWDVIGRSILPEQYAKFEKPTATVVAKK